MDVVNLKISKFGGLTKARQARDLCVSLGIAMTIEDTWGGDIVTAAIAHLAHSTPPEFLFTATDFNSYVTVSIADGAPQRVKGRMALPLRRGWEFFRAWTSWGNRCWRCGYREIVAIHTTARNRKRRITDVESRLRFRDAWEFEHGRGLPLIWTVYGYWLPNDPRGACRARFAIPSSRNLVKFTTDERKSNRQAARCANFTRPQRNCCSMNFLNSPRPRLMRSRLPSLTLSAPRLHVLRLRDYAGPRAYSNSQAPRHGRDDDREFARCEP